LLAPAVFAAPACLSSDAGCLPTTTVTSVDGLLRFLTKVTSWLFIALLFMAFIFIIIGGFTYVSSKGDPKAIASAKNYIIYALIGVAVGILAKGLVYLVCSILGTDQCPIFF
jgi:TRAP-type C4-dicarboxylate transport system permease small subunit